MVQRVSKSRMEGEEEAAVGCVNSRTNKEGQGTVLLPGVWPSLENMLVTAT